MNCGIELFENTFDFFLSYSSQRGPSTVSHNAGVMLPAPAPEIFFFLSFCLKATGRCIVRELSTVKSSVFLFFELVNV